MHDATAPVRMPVTEAERLVELDALRGVALLGVLLANFVGVAGPYVLATEAQLQALPGARIDEVVRFAVNWLVSDKANTLFAFLFGLGFYLQMRRGEGRPGFGSLYRRRLGWLLVFGVLNLVFLWQWDVLHLYALAGFLLLGMRGWSTRALVVAGVAASLYSDNVQNWIGEAIGRPLVPMALYGEEAVLARHHVAVHGNYLDVVAMQWSLTWTEWLAGGMLLAWIVYALGRFALGAAVGRSGLLDGIPLHLPRLRRIACWTLPVGLLASLPVRLLADELWQPIEGDPTPMFLARCLRPALALLVAAGYAAAVVVALHHPRWRRLFLPFAAVGRMALSNYLVQGLLIGFVLYGFGLGMAGRIGATRVVAVCLAFFALQIVASHLWLAYFRFGPMEWLWRALTYRSWPRLRREPAIAAAE